MPAGVQAVGAMSVIPYLDSISFDDYEATPNAATQTFGFFLPSPKELKVTKFGWSNYELTGNLNPAPVQIPTTAQNVTVVGTITTAAVTLNSITNTGVAPTVFSVTDPVTGNVLYNTLIAANSTQVVNIAAPNGFRLNALTGGGSYNFSYTPLVSAGNAFVGVALSRVTILQGMVGYPGQPITAKLLPTPAQVAAGVSVDPYLYGRKVFDVVNQENANADAVTMYDFGEDTKIIAPPGMGLSIFYQIQPVTNQTAPLYWFVTLYGTVKESRDLFEVPLRTQRVPQDETIEHTPTGDRVWQG